MPASPPRSPRPAARAGAAAAALALAALALAALAPAALPLRAQGAPPAAPADSAPLRALAAHFDAEAAAGRFSGVVAVRGRGRTLFHRAWGMADRARRVPNDTATRFNIGSMSKMFTAVAVAQLVERGRLRYDDPLSRFYPDFPNAADARRIRVEHLLTHTSGLGSYFGPRYMRERPQTIAGIVDVARDDARLAFAPGTGWRYSNTGFLLLGGIVEKVTGRSYYDHVRASVFDVAGMTATGSPAFGESVPKLALAYAPRGPEGRDTVAQPLYRGSSAGGGVSTSGDLLRFADALVAGRLVPPAAVRTLTTPKPGVGSEGYGYGFSAREPGPLRITGHNGGAPGTFANLDIYPDHGFATVLLSNAADGRPQQQHVQALRRAVRALAGVDTAEAAPGRPRVVEGPTPLDAADPRARRARALALLVAAGDRAGAEAYLREHGAPGYAGSPEMRRHLDEVMARVGPGPLGVVSVDALGGDRVGVPLAAGSAEPRVALAVQVGTAPPHRIGEVRLARLTLETGP